MIFLPIDVVEDLNFKKEIGMKNYQIIEYILKDSNIVGKRGTKLHLKSWVYEEFENRFDILMNCLLNGYEAENISE